MFCPKCGAEQSEEQSEGCYCSSCGVPLVPAGADPQAPADAPDGGPANRQRRKRIAIAIVATVAVVAAIVAVVVAVVTQPQQQSEEAVEKPLDKLSVLFEVDSSAAARMLESTYQAQGVGGDTTEFLKQSEQVQDIEGFEEYQDSLHLYDAEGQPLSLSMLQNGAVIGGAAETVYFVTEDSVLDSLKSFVASEGFEEESLDYYEDSQKTLHALAENSGLVLSASVSGSPRGVKQITCSLGKGDSTFAQESRSVWLSGKANLSASKSDLEAQREFEESAEGKQKAAEDEQAVKNATGTAPVDLFAVVKGDPEAGAALITNCFELYDDMGLPYYATGSQQDAESLLRYDYDAITAPLTATVINAASNEESGALGISADEVRQGNTKSVTVSSVYLDINDDPLVFMRSIIAAYGFPCDDATIVDYSGSIMAGCNIDGVAMYVSATAMHDGLSYVTVAVFAPDSVNLNPYRSMLNTALMEGAKLQ